MINLQTKIFDRTRPQNLKKNGQVTGYAAFVNLTLGLPWTSNVPNLKFLVSLIAEVEKAT